MNYSEIYKKWLNMIIALCCIIIITIPFSILDNIIEGNSTYGIQNNHKDIRGNGGISIYVPKDYPTIQQAIDNASSGNTIFVADGTYFENIIIDKSISLIGNSSKTTIINGNRTDYIPVIHISENSVNVTGLKVIDSGSGSSGIELSKVSNVQIYDCSISYNGDGIVLKSSNSNKIFNNSIVNNHYGIALFSSNLNTLFNNSISTNYGIEFRRSSLNTISNNSITTHNWGIILSSFSISNRIINNDIINNKNGINIHTSSSNKIINNDIINNKIGINILSSSLNNEVHYNNIYKNSDHGIYARSNSPLNATNNWWGDISGPYHLILNPNGKGNNVTDHVDFKPWLLIPFNITIDYIQIRTEPNGKGIIAGSKTITTDETWQLWIAVYNNSIGYLGDLPGIWNVSIDIGKISLINGSKTIFYPTRPGNGTVRVALGKFKAETGLITVIHGKLQSIKITPLNWTMFLNESKQFIGQGYDSKNNLILITPAWETNCGCTLTKNGTFFSDTVCIGTWTIYANHSNISAKAKITIIVNFSADSDSDGILDWWEIEHYFNPFNASDANLDLDYDSLNNHQEFQNSTDPNNWDTDKDDMADGWEVKKGLDPIDAKDASLDPDNDNLDNLGEYKNGSNPHNPDSDTDGLPDGWEVVNKLNLTNSSDVNKDPDLDGLSNLQEFLNGSNPQNSDTDGDNLGDGFEVIFSNTDPATWDSDGNGIGDGLEFLQKFGYTGGINTLPNNWIGMTIKWSNYTMFVSTNSSVLEAEFDKDNKKLDILLSGVKGTIGACNISIPKSLINSTENISIKLDSKPINFTLKQTKYNYYIIAKYKHSIHKFSADFGQIGKVPIEPPNKDDDNGFAYYILIILIIIIIIFILLIVLIKIRRVNLNNNIPQLPPEQLSKILEKKYVKGGMNEDTYKDIKSQLNKYKEK